MHGRQTGLFHYPYRRVSRVIPHSDVHMLLVYIYYVPSTVQFIQGGWLPRSDILENGKYRPSTRPQLSAMTADATLSASCPKWVPTASGKLLDASNSAAPALSAHKDAIEAKRAHEAAKSKSTLSVASLADSSAPTSTPSSPLITDSLQTGSESDLESQWPCKHFNMHGTFYTDIWY